VQVEADAVKVALEPNPLRPNMRQRIFSVDVVLFSGGRNANSEGLGLENVGVCTGKYSRISVDKAGRTTAPANIYAIGDVIGPPGLASAAQQQGRALVDRLFQSSIDFSTPSVLVEEHYEDDEDVTEVDSYFSTAAVEVETLASKTLFGSLTGSTGSMDAPLTLWTLPEVASVGLSVEEAQQRGMTNLIEGRAYFKDMARGRLSGGEGFLKVVARFDGKGQHSILGVHIIGEGANELIQLGSILVHGKSTLEQVSRTPFAAVTLSGLYQMACDNALFNPDCKLQ
jgi:NAD(P) transhydrogenase